MKVLEDTARRAEISLFVQAGSKLLCYNYSFAMPWHELELSCRQVSLTCPLLNKGGLDILAVCSYSLIYVHEA